MCQDFGLMGFAVSGVVGGGSWGGVGGGSIGWIDILSGGIRSGGMLHWVAQLFEICRIVISCTSNAKL